MAEKEYIEREAIEKAFAEEIHTNYLDDYAKGFQAALLAVMSIPTADVSPVRHGRWIEQCEESLYSCSVCGAEWIGIVGTPKEYGMDFCPHCGAKMDEKGCEEND